MKKVLITPRSFGKYNKEELVHLLREHDIEPIFNPYGTILSEADMMKEITDVDALIVGVDPVTSEVIKAGKQLKTIAKYGVGVDNIDCAYADAHQISVTKTMNANSNAVADYTMALLLSVARRIVEIDAGCHKDDWSKKEALDIYGKNIGVIGLGAIGRGVVERAKGFHMNVYGYDIFKNEEYIKEQNITFTDIDTIIKECDFISLHLPLTQETKHILNKENLSYAKSDLIIVNTARGGLIDEDDLYDLLKQHKIYGLGIDVFEHEPAQDSKLLELSNVIVGSHTAASSKGAINQMSMMAARHVIEELKNK